MSEAGAVDFRLQGRVTFANLVELREAGEDAIAAGGDRVVMDLSRLEHGNSAAAALLMAWYRAAERAGKSIEFQSPPRELADIIELSGLTDVLPLRGSAADDGGVDPSNLQAQS